MFTVGEIAISHPNPGTLTLWHLARVNNRQLLRLPGYPWLQLPIFYPNFESENASTMKLSTLLFTIAGFATTISAGTTFTGLGGTAYKPFCANSCYGSISAARLPCSETMAMAGMAPTIMTSPGCRANSTAYLKTLAYCISQKCVGPQEIPVWLIEQVWANAVTGSPAVQPQWDYTEALLQVTTPPTTVYKTGSVLNDTVLVNSTTYNIQYNFEVLSETSSTLIYKYS